MSDEEVEDFADDDEEIPADDIGEDDEEDEDKADKDSEADGEKEDVEDTLEVKLDPELLGDSLSLLCKTGDSLAHAYVKANISGNELTNISIMASYIHLRYVDISDNQLSDISPLASLTYLITLNAERNMLKSAELPEMPYLQYANFSSNEIKTTEGINYPLIEHLILSFNDITEVTGLDESNLKHLHTLELRGNKLKSARGIIVPNLKNLFLAGNELTSLDGLDSLKLLTTLHLRDNKIAQLDGLTQSLDQLQYINMRGNMIASISELAKLKSLNLLRALVLTENPLSEEEDYRIEALITLRTLERLDKDEYTEDEKIDAEEIFQSRQVAESANEGEQNTDD